MQPLQPINAPYGATPPRQPLPPVAAALPSGAPLGTGPPPAGWPTQLPASIPPTVPDAPNPAYPNQKVLTVFDRQVFIEDELNPPSIYAMARRWVWNNPEPDYDLPESKGTVQLPPLSPMDPVVADAVPLYEEEYDTYEPEEALRRLKQHWVSVRQHHLMRNAEQVQRSKARLQALVAQTAHVMPR